MNIFSIWIDLIIKSLKEHIENDLFGLFALLFSVFTFIYFIIKDSSQEDENRLNAYRDRALDKRPRITVMDEPNLDSLKISAEKITLEVHSNLNSPNPNNYGKPFFNPLTIFNYPDKRDTYIATFILKIIIKNTGNAAARLKIFSILPENIMDDIKMKDIIKTGNIHPIIKKAYEINYLDQGEIDSIQTECRIEFSNVTQIKINIYLIYTNELDNFYDYSYWTRYNIPIDINNKDIDGYDQNKKVQYEISYKGLAAKSICSFGKDDSSILTEEEAKNILNNLAF